MASNPEYLFTYGTLMKGFENSFARRLQALFTFEGTGSFPGLLYMVSWYPGAIYAEDTDKEVYGEVYRIPDTTVLLSELDEYEDVFQDQEKSLYVRKIIPIRIQNHSLLPCWAYLYNQDVTGLKKIESGDFRKTVIN